MRYFAGLREALGVSSEQFAAPATARTVHDVLVALRQRGGNWAEALADAGAFRVAVDQSMGTLSSTVRDGAELAVSRLSLEASMSVRVQHVDFDLSVELASLRAGHADTGATVAFVGTVRQWNQDRIVSQLELEHCPGMTEAALAEIAEQARRRWDLVDVLVVHRVGLLCACEQIVLVAVVARHRAEAFAACVRDGLSEDACAVLEEGSDAAGRTLGRRTRIGRNGTGEMDGR